MTVILASKSPRRKQLLERFFPGLLIEPAHIDESTSAGLPPETQVAHLSRLKAEAVRRSGALVIAADTLVCLDGRLLGKPRDESEAFHMLRSLSGRGHRVLSGVTAAYEGKTLTETEITEVWFRELSDREIDAYIRSGEPMDKAGAYGAQGLASIFVERIEGDFFNVMGLPMARLSAMLKTLDIELLG